MFLPNNTKKQENRDNCQIIFSHVLMDGKIRTKTGGVQLNDRMEGKPRKHLILLGTTALLATSLLVAGCASKEDKARDDLAKLSLSYTPDSFVQAAANNDQKALQLFVDAGMIPDTKDAEDETALMIAAQKGNIEAVDLLLKAKANVNAANSRGKTALSYAVEASQLSVVQKLLENGADTSLMAGNTPLLTLAVRSGNVEIIKLLLDKGADPNKQQGGSSALVEAVQEGSSDAVKLLLDAKADPNVKTPDGESLLIYTIKNNQPENAKQLIEHGADVTVKLANGVSLLTLAKASGFTDIAEALAAKGAKDVSLLTYTVGAKTEGITLPKTLENNTLTIGAHQNHPDPQVTFNLDGNAKSFTAAFASGRQDFESDYNVKLIVEGDGKKLYESDYLSIKSAPQSIDLDVGGIQKLTFRLQADKLFSVVESKGAVQNPTIYLP